MSALRVIDIVAGTTVDGPGLRTSIYFAGCRHNCPGCHNPQSHSFDAGREMSVAEILDIVADEGFNVTFSGGDPLYQNQEALNLLASGIKQLGFSLWCYTGFEFDEVKTLPIVQHIDILVDGPFKQQLRSLHSPFRGSTNQRIINVKDSLEQGKAVMIPDSFFTN